MKFWRKPSLAVQEKERVLGSPVLLHLSMLAAAALGAASLDAFYAAHGTAPCGA